MVVALAAALYVSQRGTGLKGSRNGCFPSWLRSRVEFTRRVSFRRVKLEGTDEVSQGQVSSAGQLSQGLLSGVMLAQPSLCASWIALLVSQPFDAR